jgi:ATP-dependent helicase HrpB
LADPSRLPIDDVLPALKAALAERAGAVLVAPPGAGKTTRVPLGLMDEPWATGGKLIMLEPRRLAARAAAHRMARSLGEAVGETVGYRVRLDTKVSRRTQIEVVTEGVFSRWILDDPALDGVAGVIFDEFHERSLDGDLGLAFARDSQRLLREDLRLLVMSATLDGAAVARLLGDAPVIESQGRMFEVATRYLGRDPAASIEDQTVRAVSRALDSESGGVLVFLPGQGEIERTAVRLRERLGDAPVDIAPLYGAMESADQDLAIAPSPDGRRKVVLATSIAQTSLTLEGIGVVVDAGLARVPRFDPASGVTRLATVRVSRAAADQRRGRAGRTGPGVCYRLWDEAETRALIPADRPEILETDLTRLALDLARWGARDAEALALLDRPPPGALVRARSDLERLGALDGAGALTAHGAAMSRLPLPPRLAHMVIAAAAHGQARRAAQIAVLIAERGLGGASPDLSHRLDRFAADRSPRARSAAALAGRLADQAGVAAMASPLDDGLILALAFPERIAKARDGGGDFQLVGGRGVRLDPVEALAREPWLAVAEVGGGAARDRILLAARLDIDAYRRMFPDALRREERLESGPGGRLRAKETLWLGALAVEERLIADPDPALIQTALLEEVRRAGVGVLPWGDGATALRARVRFLRAGDEAWPDLSDEALAAELDGWLAPLLAGKSSLAQVSDHALETALRDRIGWPLNARLEAEAPGRWAAPTGTSVAIAYGESGPSVEVRVQELFGLDRHPTIGRGVPLALHLLSPARRPIQVTTDLPGFWRGSWAEVRKAMRGRYPKHPWPEDPIAAPPTIRAKPRG